MAAGVSKNAWRAAAGSTEPRQEDTAAGVTARVVTAVAPFGQLMPTASYLRLRDEALERGPGKVMAGHEFDNNRPVLRQGLVPGRADPRRVVDPDALDSGCFCHRRIVDLTNLGRVWLSAGHRLHIVDHSDASVMVDANDDWQAMLCERHQVGRGHQERG